MYINDSVQFSHSVVSDSLRSHESQHARPPCLSPTPAVHSNSCPSSQWCHPAISSSVVPFSSCPQSLPASGSFPMSQLFTWGGQSIGVSASTWLVVNKAPMGTSRAGRCTSCGLSWLGIPQAQVFCPRERRLSYRHSKRMTINTHLRLSCWGCTSQALVLRTSARYSSLSSLLRLGSHQVMNPQIWVIFIPSLPMESPFFLTLSLCGGGGG